jgi:hypothetical protein
VLAIGIGTPQVQGAERRRSARVVSRGSHALVATRFRPRPHWVVVVVHCVVGGWVDQLQASTRRLAARMVHMGRDEVDLTRSDSARRSLCVPAESVKGWAISVFSCVACRGGGGMCFEEREVTCMKWQTYIRNEASLPMMRS